MADCFKQIRKQLSKEDVSDDAIRKVLDQVEDLKKSPDFRSASKDLLEKQRTLSARAMKERAENLLKTKSRMELYQQDVFSKDKKEAMLAALGGTSVLAKGGNLSVDRIQQVIAAKLQNALRFGLEDAGVFEVVKKGLIDRELMQELFELRPGGRVGISGSAEAKAAAKVFRDVQTLQLRELRRAGIDIGETPGFIMSQSHNRDLINPNPRDLDTDFNQWFADIMPRLDDSTFEGVKDRTPFMRQIFDDIASGKRDNASVEGVSDQLITTIKGGSPNLSKKLGRSRTLHFKDGNNFFEYNDKYGTKDLVQATMATIDKSARSAGLVSVFGTNPRAAMEGDIRRLSMEHSDAEAVRRAMNEADGVTRIPGRGLVAKIAAGSRKLASMSKLGSAALAAIADVGTTGAAIRSGLGDNYLGATLKGIKGFADVVKPSEKAKFYRALGRASDDVLGGMYNRFSLDEGPGALSKAQNVFFQLNGVAFQASTAQLGIAKHFAEAIAENSSKSWDGLTNRIRANIERYGIGDQEWGLIRQGVDELDDGVKIVTPEAIEALPDSAYKAAGFKDADKARHALGIKYASYLSDHAEFGSPVPNLRQRAVLLRGHGADTAEGQLLRLVTQFKSFPVAMHSVVKRALLSDPDNTASSLTEALRTGQFDGQNLSGMIVMGTMLGYIGMSAKNLAAGKAPPDPEDPKTWAEAFVRSGTAGLYGDFLYGEYDQMYRSFLKDAVGPVLGQADDVTEIFSAATKGDVRSGKALRLIKNNMPGQNLFYTKAATDYLVWWRLQEALNPGYLRRLEKRAKKDGSEFIFFSPTEAR